jgi:hypothetical protein
MKLCKQAKITVLGKDWPKICEEMYAALPPEQAAKALNIVTKYTQE